MKTKIYLILFVVFTALMHATPIITKWNTNANSDNSIQITIPTVGAYTYTYYKANNPSVTGSGSGISGNTTITFPSVGEYIVTITPNSIFRFSFSYSTFSSPSNKLIELQQWGTTSWNTDLSGMFMGCSNLKITATDIPYFSNVTNMALMFNYCTSLTTIPNANSWNTSNVANMSGMFNGATNFNQSIGSWNTSKVTLMGGMFRGVLAFNQNIGSWDTSKVTNMNEMFLYASAFNQNLGNWTLNSNVNLQSMLTNSGMGCENYSKTLKGWAENPNTPTGRNLGNVKGIYGPAGQTYRNILTNGKGWTITGDSYDAGCTVILATTDINKKEIALYPNPAKDILHFSEEAGNISITDLSGRLVKQVSTFGKTIDVSKLPKGTYIISATTKAGKAINRKIIKD